MATRLGVDVGGTFTDLTFYDEESREVRVAKVPTTPGAPENGVITAVSSALSDDLVASAKFFLHGTTVGLNALLERAGASIGILTTRGFRDILEIRRGDREEMYNLVWAPTAPLVPRRLRLPITERVMADGTLRMPLEEDGVREAAEVFAAEGVTSVAVTFLHAYANPENELAAEQALRRFGFAGEISLSHRISGEYREYERSCTTIVDAYVRPRVATYLERLEQGLRERGFGGHCLLTRSGGGAMTFSEGEARPVETILSGPVAGAEGAVQLSRAVGFSEVITADVGGTSFDTCLISDGRAQLMYEGSVIGLPLQIPWVDVRSIGAGGGSIAYVDAGGLLRVGPRSAGAEPGPAAYGRGGKEATVTDAALALGMLAEGELAGGIRLDVDKAKTALATVAENIGLDAYGVARGVLKIVTAHMADAIREITIERGRDPRDAALLAFGGAGPLLGVLLARELDVHTIVVPPYAGNFSAWGLLGSNVTQTAAQTRIVRLGPEGLSQASEALAALFRALELRVSGGIDGGGATNKHAALEMRYIGQEHTLSVPIGFDPSTYEVFEDEAAVRTAFADEYERVYAHALEEPVEIVHVRAALEVPLPKLAQATQGQPVAADVRTWRAYSFAREDWLDFAVHQRDALGAGDVVAGPAIVLEQTATTYVDDGFDMQVHPSGCLILTEQGARE